MIMVNNIPEKSGKLMGPYQMIGKERLKYP